MRYLLLTIVLLLFAQLSLSENRCGGSYPQHPGWQTTAPEQPGCRPKPPWPNPTLSLSSAQEPEFILSVMFQPSGWREGSYNLFLNHCHNASDCGAGTFQRGVAGVFLCYGDRMQSGTHQGEFRGHAINYVAYRADGQTRATICLSEPQSASPTEGVCCWEQENVETNRDLSSSALTAVGRPGRSCYRYMCGSPIPSEAQTNDAGGRFLPRHSSGGSQIGNTNQSLTGTRNTVGTCAGISNERQSCMSCCGERTSYWDSSIAWSCTREKYRQSMEHRCDFNRRCRVECSLRHDVSDAGTRTKQVPVSTAVDH